MLVYPLSLAVTAFLMLGALLVCRPTTRLKRQQKEKQKA